MVEWSSTRCSRKLEELSETSALKELYDMNKLEEETEVSGEELPEDNWKSELLKVIIRKLGAVNDSFTISLANKKFKAELCIYRVPEKPVKEDDYSPRVVAIGPFHRKNGNLAAMSQHKMFYMISFLHQNGSGLNPVECLRQCIDAIHELDVAIRLCYFENIDYTNSELAEMMLIDGCFILELFLRNHLSSDYIMENEFGTDLVLRSAWIATALKHDLALLENQIPFFILEILYSILHPVIEKRCRAPQSVAVLALKFFKPMSQKVITEEVVPECMHLLDLLHKFYFTPVPGVFLTNIGNDIESNTNPEKGIPEKWGFDNCASELLESAGIEFRDGSNPKGSLLNITLYQLHPNVVINMPKLLIHDTSISLFRNLIAFEERSLGSTKSVTSYAFLLRSLICSSKDSRLLKGRGVIRNISNGDEEFFVTKFRSIVDGVDLMDYCFQEVCDRVNDEYHKSWSILNRLKTIFREQIRFLWIGYLFSAWKIMSILAAAAILILTSLQTYYTINPRK